MGSGKSAVWEEKTPSREGSREKDPSISETAACKQKKRPGGDQVKPKLVATRIKEREPTVRGDVAGKKRKE